nr:hypothetical protein [uncultured Undibacterium sp.]
MKSISINKQSRNELNASIIFAAMTWSLMMIFKTELIAEIGATFFNLLPMLPIAAFYLAFHRHHQGGDQTARRAISGKMGVAMALTAVFVCNFSAEKGADFSQISALSSYSFFAVALVVLLLIRRGRTC